MAQPIGVDAKFPLEAYRALIAAPDDSARTAARRALAQALRAHIRAISERYILPGETAEGALMFLPSEAVYAELHATLPDVVREGFAARVWVVSPTTLMATLITLRATLKDTRLRAEAQAVRREIALMAADAETPWRACGQAGTAYSAGAGAIWARIRISADKITRRGARLDSFDFAQGG